MMNPELNREYPAPDEAGLIEKMVRIAIERMKPVQGRIRRGQHAKATGCVRGVFTIRDDVPAELRYGVFAKPKQVFQAIIRFSNASETINPDGKGDGRGMAIKLLAVDGTSAIAGTDNSCQDFLTVNYPVFPFATAAEFVKFFDIRETPFVGDPLAVAWLAFSNYRHLNIARDILGEIVTSPLELTYWSGSPYWLGSADSVNGYAVKYSLVPGFEEPGPPQDPGNLPDDYLHQALARQLKTREAVFEFRVQLQADPVAMPVEDASVLWEEALSRPIPVATLTIGVQDVDSPKGRALAEECEAMAFSPWNALAEHRPMGGINRLRQAVYLASQEKRAAKKLTKPAEDVMKNQMKELQKLKGIGEILSRRLVEASYDTIAKVAAAEEKGLGKIAGMNPQKLRSIVTQARTMVGEVEKNQHSWTRKSCDR